MGWMKEPIYAEPDSFCFIRICENKGVCNSLICFILSEN